MDDPTTTNNCAAGPQCLMPTAPVTKTHCCPAGCGKDVHKIHGESNVEAHLLYSTTCFQCVRVRGRVLKGPNDYQDLPAVPPVAGGRRSMHLPTGGRGSGQGCGRGRGHINRGQGAADVANARRNAAGNHTGGRGGRGDGLNMRRSKCH
jgi:hypothetical protein